MVYITRMATKRAAGQHIALLRGINVGGRNKLPMKALVGMFEAAGCTDVRSYIQSGNVVFRAPAALAKRIGGLIRSAITDAYGYSVPLVCRTAKQLDAAIAANPYLRRGEDPKSLHLAFLTKAPTASQCGDLDPLRSTPDEFTVVGRDIYLYLPNGVARSKLTNKYFDGKLDTVSTLRNWRTVLKLQELAG